MLTMTDDAPRAVGMVGSISAVTGAMSVALSTRAIRRHRAFIAAEREAVRQRQVSIAPLVPVTASSRAGLMLNVSF
jgi:hypothetical protein